MKSMNESNESFTKNEIIIDVTLIGNQNCAWSNEIFLMKKFSSTINVSLSIVVDRCSFLDSVFVFEFLSKFFGFLASDPDTYHLMGLMKIRIWYDIDRKK